LTIDAAASFESKKQALRVVSDHPVPVLAGMFENALSKGGNPGVVDQNAHRPERLLDLLQGRLQLPLSSDIDAERQGRTTHLL
jgi:hypothetical protein